MGGMSTPPSDPAWSALPRSGGGWALTLAVAVLAAGAGGAVAFARNLLAERDAAREDAQVSEHARADAEARAARARDLALAADDGARSARERAAQAQAAGERAEAERAEALAARRTAEDASATLLLEARVALAPLGRHAALERLARTALEAGEGASDEALSPAGQETRAQALTLLGESLLARERPEEADEPLRQALALARRRAAARPEGVAGDACVVDVLRLQARAWRERGLSAEALDALEEAIGLLRRLGKAEPTVRAWIGRLGETLAEAAPLLADLRRSAPARAYAEEALGLLQALSREEPSGAAWVFPEALALAALADVEAHEADLQPALVDYDRAVSRLQPLADAPGAEPALRIALVDLRRRQAATLVRAGQVSEAVDALREALSISAGLAGRDPERLDVQVLLAEVCGELCDALEANAEFEDALQGRQETAAAWSRVAALEGGRVERRLAVLHALLNLGDLLERRGNAEQALLAFREGAALALALGESAALQAAYGSDLALLHDRAAQVLLTLGRRAEALSTWRAALAAIEPLAKKTPENAFWQADLARIWWRLGTALMTQELDRAEGQRALRRAQRLLAALTEARRLPDYAQAWPEAIRSALAAAPGAPGGSAPGAPTSGS